MKQEMILHTEAGNNLWFEAIEMELKQINEYNTFRMLEKGEGVPMGCQKIPYHIVFYVKFDLRRTVRLVAGGN